MTAANDFAVRPGILSGRGGADQPAGSATGGRIRILNDTNHAGVGLLSPNSRSPWGSD